MITNPIRTFKSGDYVATREVVPGTRVDGLYVAGTTTTIAFEASIQPLKGSDLKVLPAGSKVEDTRLVLTTTELLCNDVVTYKGEPWTVITAEDWSFRGVTWTRAYMTRNTLGV